MDRGEGGPRGNGRGPLDLASGWLYFGGAGLTGLAVAIGFRRQRRLGWLWSSYGVILLLAGIEESDWLRGIFGHNVKLAGHNIGALHDLLTQVVAQQRSGSSEYLYTNPQVLGALVLAAGGLALVGWLAVRRDRLLDPGLVLWLVLGAVLSASGGLIDADMLHKPSLIVWKAHIEEPLEFLGACCLAIVAVEVAIRSTEKARE